MKKILFVLSIAASITVASAQTTPNKKEDCKKECCSKKEKKSCCSPSSKAKAIQKASTEKKG